MKCTYSRNLTTSPAGIKCGAAALSVIIALGLFAGIPNAFQRDGTPYERIVAAERTCSEYKFVSERDDCVRSRLASAQPRNVASR